MADIITNLTQLNDGKGYVKTIYQRGRDLVGDELNESFDIERILRRRTITKTLGEGFYELGWDILPCLNANEIIIKEGAGIGGGEYLDNDAALPFGGLTTPVGSDRTDIVYIEVFEVEVDSATDPDIEFADVGETTRRLKLQINVKVDEGSGTLPTSTGELHEAGIRYLLLGFLNRLDGVDIIDASQIVDARTIIGQIFLNEDKNLEFIGGGEVLWNSTTGAVTWGLVTTAPDNNGTVFQPSTPGNAILDASDGTHNPFVLANPEDVAYINLNRAAAADYNVTIQIGTASSIPNNANAFVIAMRGSDDRLYWKDGTVWDDGQQHLVRIAPFTGMIVDADVAPPGVANINGAKLAIGSVPLDRLVSIPSFPSDLSAINFQSSTCPVGWTKLEIGSDDTFLRLAGVGGSPNLTPAGSNSHGHGTHAHGSGSYRVVLPLFDISIWFTGGGFNFNFDAFQASVGGGWRNQSFYATGTSSSSAISTVGHEPKRVQGVICQKD